MIAAGQKIDTDRAERFSAQVDKVFSNPYTNPEKPMTAAEIKQHIVNKIDELLSGG